MDRRSFLRTATLGAGAATLAAPAIAQGTRRLVMATAWTRGASGVFDPAVRVAETISTLTDGALSVEVLAADELMPAFEVFDAASQGQIDMYHASETYFVGKHPGLAFFATMPFGMTPEEQDAWYTYGEGRALYDELTEPFNLKSFLCGNTGVQPGGWFNTEINAPEDFAGLRFRMGGLGGQALARMGADVQSLPGGEVYNALASGALDGTEWIGAWGDESAGFHEIAQFYYTSGFHEPGGSLALGMNRTVFDELPESQQRAIEVATSEAHHWSMAQFKYENGAALDRLIAGGVQLRDFPDAVWAAMGKATSEVIEANRDGDLFDRLLDSTQASMRQSSGWVARSQGIYQAQRDRVLGLVG